MNFSQTPPMPTRCNHFTCAPDLHVQKICGNIYPKYFLLLGFFLLVFQLSFATAFTSPETKDTTGPVLNDYQLNREQFYATYGRDDSSRALISFYFHKRNNAKKLTFVGFIMATLSILFINVFIANNSSVQGTGDAVAGTLLVNFVGLISAASLVLMITGIVRWVIFSRKKLLRLLNDYFAGRSIPSHISKSKLFNKWLIAEKGRHLQK
jgi:hypothetical protein